MRIECTVSRNVQYCSPENCAIRYAQRVNACVRTAHALYDEIEIHFSIKPAQLPTFYDPTTRTVRVHVVFVCVRVPPLEFL